MGRFPKKVAGLGPVTSAHPQWSLSEYALMLTNIFETLFY